jgi:hypothetical protein
MNDISGVDEDLTEAREFRDDDDGYLDWLAAHPDGYVINILRSHNPAAARMHTAGCWTIGGRILRGRVWTGQYVKVCADTVEELQGWAEGATGQPVSPYGACQPSLGDVQRRPAKLVQYAVPSPPAKGRCESHGPANDLQVVQAWADDYLRFEHRPAWQDQLRDDIRSRCRQLQPSAEQVLHATYFGTKLPNADVENVLLYYIDSFRIAGAKGIRFEHGEGDPFGGPVAMRLGVGGSLSTVGRTRLG